MSLNLIVTKKNIGEISINYDELKQELDKALNKYKGILVTEDTVTLAKKDKALLNKVAKAINDRKIELKKEFLAPYEDIENQIKELIGMITNITADIDSQIKAFDEKDKTRKKESINEMWTDLMKNEDLPFLSLEACFDERWLNKSFTLVNIVSEMKLFIQQTKQELSILSDMFEGEELLSAKSKYYQTIDLYDTLEKMKLEKTIKDSIKERQKATHTAEEEQLYTLQFEVIATENQIKALSNFLRDNNYKYQRIDKEN